jgi:hypothetical protein
MRLKVRKNTSINYQKTERNMGVYMYPDILVWFQEEYVKHVSTKLDMGKGCIRFKKMESIPYDLITELCRKITVNDYLNKYKLEINK